MFTTAAPKGDLAYHFTPYQPGEKLRPEARPATSATEGIAPFTVNFTSAGAAAAQWDFGDGSTSGERNPSHTFAKPGIYAVTLTVTDRDGDRAQNFLNIAVDRKFNDPIVRAGFATGDGPALKLHGTATRKSDGSLHLPEGAPWGWVDAGESVLDDLLGLRSFTIMGWLKPESLKTGSGGNRIVFCLKGDHSGIDLVCHSDGRLRLAVNQWPDGVKNDSSPGKLVTGQWTFFAVTYTTTRTKENVQWHFSAPQLTPDPAAEISLDLKTTHNAGSVGTDVGPLAIGNFNATMRGSGLDRQFCGEIRDLQIFGSCLGVRGALSLEETKKRMR